MFSTSEKLSSEMGGFFYFEAKYSARIFLAVLSSPV
jgi:hypothetical protein